MGQGLAHPGGKLLAPEIALRSHISVFMSDILLMLIPCLSSGRFYSTSSVVSRNCTLQEEEVDEIFFEAVPRSFSEGFAALIPCLVTATPNKTTAMQRLLLSKLSKSVHQVKFHITLFWKSFEREKITLSPSDAPLSSVKPAQKLAETMSRSLKKVMLSWPRLLAVIVAGTGTR